MKNSMLIATSLLVFVASPCADAKDRYANQQPVLVSSDLTGAWVTQLRVAPRVAGYSAPLPLRQFQAPGQPMRRLYSAAAPAYAGQHVGNNAQPGPLLFQQQQQQVLPRQRTLFQAPAQQYGIGMNRFPNQQQYAQPTQQVAMMAPQNPGVTPIEPQFLPQEVAYETKEKSGTLVIDTNNRFLYLVLGHGMARRYGVGVGKPGFEWAGVHHITRKAEWPDWTPPAQMISREAAKGHFLPARMDGGIENPLGSRAMYIGNTQYRIHGTNAPWTIGYAVSSGCIRMRNQDVEDLYERVPVGAKVVVQ